MKNELDDAPLFALYAAEREIRKRMARDNRLLAQVRKQIRHREKSRALSDDKMSTQA